MYEIVNKTFSNVAVEGGKKPLSFLKLLHIVQHN